jgi:hypothetical protein
MATRRNPISDKAKTARFCRAVLVCGVAEGSARR